MSITRQIHFDIRKMFSQCSRIIAHTISFEHPRILVPTDRGTVGTIYQCPSMTDVHAKCSMCLIDTRVLWRVLITADRKQVDRRTKVFDFCDDEATAYVILFHRWNDSTEVNYEAIADLAQVNAEGRDEICHPGIQEDSGYLSVGPFLARKTTKCVPS